MIHKIIHQIWLQSYNNMPDKLKEYHINCKKINNDFKFIFWDDNKIKQLIRQYYDSSYLDIYNSYDTYAQKSDIARYLILYIYGGIYLDTDVICLKNLSKFTHHSFFLTYEDDILSVINKKRSLVNGMIGSKKNHDVFKIIFKNIKSRINKKSDISYSTGPKLLHDSIKEYIRMYPIRNDITIIEPKYLHPCPYYSVDNCYKTAKDAYTIHINDASWSNYVQIFTLLLRYRYYVLTLIFIYLLFLLAK